MKVAGMFTYPSLIGTAAPGLEDCRRLAEPSKGSALKKAIYVIGLVVLGSALVIQSFWG
jgi:hypothetical protein